MLQLADFGLGETNPPQAEACATCGYRRLKVAFIPFLGRRVTVGCILMFCPGTIWNWYCCAIVASSNTASIVANPAPMQTLGPPPKGKYANRGRDAARGSL